MAIGLSEARKEGKNTREEVSEEIRKKIPQKKGREGETSNVVTTKRGAKPAKLHFLRMFRVI
jgi:hypothetical protein